MLVPKYKISLRQDEDGVWIAKSDLLPGCHAYGKAEAEAVLEFQEAARAHLEALLDFARNSRKGSIQLAIKEDVYWFLP
jgi:predicted RNase H-like HicB family nuclease